MEDQQVLRLRAKVLRHGLNIINRQPSCDIVDNRRYRGCFGTSARVTLEIWWLLLPYRKACGINKIKMKHLLWSLMLLNKYAGDEFLSAVAGVDEKTFRKWTWELVFAIADLASTVILWENRYAFDKGNDCLVSLDGTDCEIEECAPFPEKKKWYSIKFKCAGYRYEVAVCILTGSIVWINGPFRCGEWSDIKIFKRDLIHMLDENERVEADKGYVGADPSHAKTPNGLSDLRFKPMSSIARVRHETINAKIKSWEVLSTKFRHSEDKHWAAFHAVSVATQLAIEAGEVTFDLSEVYDDSIPFNAEEFLRSVDRHGHN